MNKLSILSEFVLSNFAGLLGLLLGVVVGIPLGVVLTLHWVRV